MHTRQRALRGVIHGFATFVFVIAPLYYAYGSNRHSKVVVDVPAETVVRPAVSKRVKDPAEPKPAKSKPLEVPDVPVAALPLDAVRPAQPKAIPLPIHVIQEGDCFNLTYSRMPVRQNAAGDDVYAWNTERVPCNNPDAPFMGQDPLFPVMLRQHRTLVGERSNTEITQAMLSSLAGLRDDPTTKRIDAKPHEGWDIRARKGTPIVAQYDAKVTQIMEDRSCGKRITLDYQEQGILIATFCHLSAYPLGIKVGHRVKRGEVVAFSGASGNATRNGMEHPHIHLQFKVDFDRLAAAIRSARTPEEARRLETICAEFKKCKVIQSDVGVTIDPFCFAWTFQHRSQQPTPPTKREIAKHWIREQFRR